MCVCVDPVCAYLKLPIVTLPADVNGLRKVRTAVFVAGYVSCFQMNPQFTLDFLDMCGRIWWRRNEWHANVTLQFRERFESVSVIVWGGFTMTDRTHLHIVQGSVTWQYYWDNMLIPFVIPFARLVGFVFQDDNAHCAQIINTHLQQLREMYASKTTNQFS